MIQVFGPCNPRRVYAGADLRLQPEVPFVTEASSLGEAIADYARHFTLTITPCRELLPGARELKYFDVSGAPPRFPRMVDIHVEREGRTLCPKQDLAFALRPGDVIEMGPLAC